MISGTENPQVISLENSRVLFIYKSPVSFHDSGKEKKVFERETSLKLLRDFLKDQTLEIEHMLSGQPFISNSIFNISISHSGNWFALLLSEKEPVGVDIQTHTSKLSKARAYFINETEEKTFRGQFSDEQLYAIWCAKEAVFKKLGGEIADLKNDVSIVEIDETTTRLSYLERDFSFLVLRDDEKTIVAG